MDTMEAMKLGAAMMKPNQSGSRGTRAEVVNEKRHENHDEIEAEGHSELGEGNEENVSIISLIHSSDHGDTPESLIIR
jgi:hypothetical protein